MARADPPTDPHARAKDARDRARRAAQLVASVDSRRVHGDRSPWWFLVAGLALGIVVVGILYAVATLVPLGGP